MALTDKLTAIADAIREKTGSTDTMTLDKMAENMSGIESTSETLYTGIYASYESDSLDSDADSIANIYVDTLSVDAEVFLNAVNNTKGGYVFSWTVTVDDNSEIVSPDTWYLDGAEIDDISSYGITFEIEALQTGTITGTVTVIVTESQAELILTKSITGEFSSDTLTRVPIYAFADCPYLTALYLPSVTHIGQNAFSYSTGLTKVWIPSTCTFISGTKYSYSPFYQCSSTLEIFTDAEEALDGWCAYWNYINSSKTLTVHYGASYEDYEAA